MVSKSDLQIFSLNYGCDTENCKKLCRACVQGRLNESNVEGKVNVFILRDTKLNLDTLPRRYN